jgi:hypothetical protein
MHSEMFSVCASACALGCAAPGPPPGISLWQLAWAALKAGEDGSIPVLRWMPPPGPGSGKLATPCERMHSLKGRNTLWCAAWLWLLEDPQAATAAAQVMAASAMRARWHAPPGGLLVRRRLTLKLLRLTIAAVLADLQ